MTKHLLIFAYPAVEPRVSDNEPPLAEPVVFSRCGHPVHAQCLVGLERDEEGPFFSAAKTLGSQGSSSFLGGLKHLFALKS